jgi:hypothetical protein
MRRIAALALSATAMCTVLATTTGAANASTGSYGNSSFGSNARSASVTPTSVGKKHYFHDTSVSGVAVKGDWYWIKLSGKNEIWLDATLYDTKADGQQVAMAWRLTGGLGSGMLLDLKGGGTHVTQSGWIPPTAHFQFRDMRGHWNATSKLFTYTAISTMHQVR